MLDSAHYRRRPTPFNVVTVKNQVDATKYAVLLRQHVSGNNMPIIRSKISKYLPLLGGHTWKAALGFLE
jgi:hypothetical protein